MKAAKIEKIIMIIFIIGVLGFFGYKLLVYSSEKQIEKINNETKLYKITLSFGDYSDELVFNYPECEFDLEEYKLHLDSHKFINITDCNGNEITESKIKINKDTNICYNYAEKTTYHVNLSYMPEILDKLEDIFVDNGEEINLDEYIVKVDGKKFKGWQELNNSKLYNGKYKVTKNVNLFAIYE